MGSDWSKLEALHSEWHSLWSFGDNWQLMELFGGGGATGIFSIGKNAKHHAMPRHYCTKHCPTQKVHCHYLLRQRLQDDVIHTPVQLARKAEASKWYLATSDKKRMKEVWELTQVVLACNPKMHNFLQWRDHKVVYRRYAKLYLCCTIRSQDNELIPLELTNRYVKVLDKSFSSVCEHDIIFNFEKGYFILDEFLMGGWCQEECTKGYWGSQHAAWWRRWILNSPHLSHMGMWRASGKAGHKWSFSGWDSAISPSFEVNCRLRTLKQSLPPSPNSCFPFSYWKFLELGGRKIWPRPKMWVLFGFHSLCLKNYYSKFPNPLITVYI